MKKFIKKQGNLSKLQIKDLCFYLQIVCSGEFGFGEVLLDVGEAKKLNIFIEKWIKKEIKNENRV
jgi:hypothetical protein